ncbi:MAG: hypothetical protein WBN65_08055 [Gammaproteobacteria bacterium]
MNVYELVFAIVLVVTLGKVLEGRFGSRNRHRRETQPGPQEQERTQRVDDLEQRVQVLERIVTDQGYELRQKFRDLED